MKYLPKLATGEMMGWHGLTELTTGPILGDGHELQGRR